MSETNIKSFAQKIGVEPEHLLKQLISAGIKGKKVDDDLTNDEKCCCLNILAVTLKPSYQKHAAR